MTLQEVKLVLDWAKQRLDYANGSKYSEPESYRKKFDEYKLIQNLYDKMCEGWIENNIENKQFNNPSL